MLGQVAGRDLEIRPTDRARGDTKQELASAGLRLGEVHQFERALPHGAWSINDEGLHPRQS
jgi:hypothetical protein